MDESKDNNALKVFKQILAELKTIREIAESQHSRLIQRETDAAEVAALFTRRTSR